MTRLLQRLLRLATLLIAVSVPAAALAVATVDVRPTGAKTNETTIQLFDNTGAQVPPDANNPNRFSVQPGSYRVDVYVGGRMVGLRRQTINLADGNNQLRVDSDTGIVEIVPPPAGVKPVYLLPAPGASWWWLAGGPGGFTDKAPWIGVFPTTDSPAARFPTHVNMTFLNVGVNDFAPQSPTGFGWHLGGMDGNRTSSTQVAPGTSVGWIYRMPTVTGSTGVSTNGGLNAILKTTIYDVNVGLTFPAQTFKYEDFSKGFGNPEIWARYLKSRYQGMLSVPVSPNIFSTTDDSIKQYEFGLGYGLSGEHTFPSRLVGSIGAGADAIFYHANYSGMQLNVCPLCSGASQNFSVGTSDSKNRLAFGLSASAGLTYPISDSLSLSFRLRYQVEFGTAILNNKITPSGSGPDLGTGTRQFYVAEFGAGFR